MKKTNAILLLSAILACGCERAEKNLYTLKTNFTEVVTTVNGVMVTNQVPSVVLEPKASIESGIGAAGGVASMIWPPAGWIATVLVSLYGVYAKLRSKKVAEALVQGTEVLREVIKTFPLGAKLDDAVVGTLVSNQKSAGVHEDIKKLTPDVDGREAKGDAQAIVKESKETVA